jgi:Zn finger protein HypA/HybF involved in hydrogenase expression
MICSLCRQKSHAFGTDENNIIRCPKCNERQGEVIRGGVGVYEINLEQSCADINIGMCIDLNKEVTG